MTASKESWQCSACKSDNEADSSACSLCGALKPEKGKDGDKGASPRVRQDAGGGRVSRETMLLPAAPVRAHAGDATVETGAVATVEESSSAEMQPRRRSLPMRRFLPLLSMIGVLLAALVAAVVWLAGGPQRTGPGGQSGSAPGGGIVAEVVTLPATSAIIGLSDDNKENVLTLCNRASSNPNRECRRSYLEEIGEFPHREVDIGALQVDRMEASNRDYEACVSADECSARDWDECRYYSIYRYEFGRAVPIAFRDADHPAVCMTMSQAQEFCQSRDMRLPTAAEWERAARSGDDRLWPWGRFWAPGILNWGEFDMMAYPIAGRLDGYQGTAPVDAFPDGANRDGLLNTLGNVAEWTLPAEGDPENSGGVSGGHYADNAFDLRLTNRLAIDAEQARSTVGVRCVADAP
jgi:iron(II)-dependent oxidoreductase